MGYSKGPWKFKRAKDEGQTVGFLVIGSKGERIVFFEPDEYGYGNSDEVEGNGKLIAAAPELLEALKMAFVIIKHEMVPISNHGDPLAIQDCLKTIDEAIKQATQ